MQVEKKNPEFVMKTFPLTEAQAKKASLVSPIQHSEPEERIASNSFSKSWCFHDT